MSLQADRLAFGTALAGVAGIASYVDAPETISSPGDAYARWVSLEAQGAPLLFLVTWEIVVVAGRTQADGLAFLDSKLTSILDALDQLAFITEVRPSVILTPVGDLFGVIITAKKES